MMDKWSDFSMPFVQVLVIVALMLAMFCMAVFASFATLWPYNLTPSFNHYVSGLVDAELGVAMFNSLKLASCTAVIGTVVVSNSGRLRSRPACTSGNAKLPLPSRMFD